LRLFYRKTWRFSINTEGKSKNIASYKFFEASIPQKDTTSSRRELGRIVNIDRIMM
jgi:hypothetical protein